MKRALLALLLLSSCPDWTMVREQFCDERPDVCLPDGGVDGGSTDGG